MSLLSDIINELVDARQGLEGPLLKTKVLATRLKNESLLSWVNQELEGYPSIEEMPDYRVYISILSMDYILGNNQVNNQPVPISLLPERFQKILVDAVFGQSVAMLESSLASNESGTLEIPLPSEVRAVVQNSIRETGGYNARVQILSLRKTVPVTFLNQLLATVRNRLLTLMLKLEEEFGEEVTISSLQANNQQITNIVNNTIHNQGHGNVINTGDQANINATITVQQQDFNTLAEKLRTEGVAETDITELAEVIDSEPVDLENQRFGPRVNQWIQKMIGKTLDGGWDIATGAAGGLLTEVIKAYLGMGN